MTEITFRPITQDEFLAAIETLAAAIENSDWKPDFIVGVGRGGLVPGCFLSHRTGIPLLSVDHSSKVFHFAESLLVHLAVCTRTGERYLFVDDINDTGKTLAHMKQAIASHGGEAANVRYAVMIDNRSSSERVDYAAQVIDREVDKDWFVFPWEAVAPAATLSKEAMEDPDRLSLDRA
jgi:hypoxanthine phosphoribosyltransferase